MKECEPGNEFMLLANKLERYNQNPNMKQIIREVDLRSSGPGHWLEVLWLDDLTFRGYGRIDIIRKVPGDGIPIDKVQMSHFNYREASWLKEQMELGLVWEYRY